MKHRIMRIQHNTYLGAKRRRQLFTSVVGIRGNRAVAIVLGAAGIGCAVDRVEAVVLVEHLQFVA